LEKERSDEALSSFALAVISEQAEIKSLLKYQLTDCVHDESIYDAAEQAQLRSIRPFIKNKSICSAFDVDSLLEIKAAILRVPRGTSNGYPWTIEYKKKLDLLFVPCEYNNSSECFLFGENYYTFNYDFIEVVLQVWQILESGGNLPPTYLSVVLKDERRDIDRVKAGKTRAIYVMPVHILIIEEILCRDFNDSLVAHWESIGHTCGYNHYGGDWNRIISTLAKFKYFTADDVSGFDGSTQNFHLQSCNRIRNAFYVNEHSKTTLTNLYNNCLIRAYFVSRNGIVLEKESGQISGNLNTLTDNSIIRKNCQYYYVLSRKISSWVGFVLGDDAIIATNSKIDFDDYSKVMSNLGYTVTLEYEGQLAEEISFLANKSIIYQHNKRNYYLPLPNFNKLYSSFTFIRDKYKGDVLHRIQKLSSLRISACVNESLFLSITRTIEELTEQYRSVYLNNKSFKAYINTLNYNSEYFKQMLAGIRDPGFLALSQDEARRLGDSMDYW
jgi:hypothetical protein